MRKLKFMANTQSQTPRDGQETQEYVAHLLAEELGKYGFQTLSPVSYTHLRAHET